MRRRTSWSREGISLIVIRLQLGQADLAITSRYLRGIDNTEIIAAIHQRPARMVPADPRALALGRQVNTHRQRRTRSPPTGVSRHKHSNRHRGSHSHASQGARGVLLFRLVILLAFTPGVKERGQVLV